MDNVESYIYTQIENNRRISWIQVKQMLIDHYRASDLRTSEKVAAIANVDRYIKHLKSRVASIRKRGF